MLSITYHSKVTTIGPQGGSAKGTVLNINHDIVPQAIGKTLTRASQDKEISKGNATQHTTTLQEEGIK